ncbi:MAG: M1 family metallopeptidase [Planctomycetota bacterium]
MRLRTPSPRGGRSPWLPGARAAFPLLAAALLLGALPPGIGAAMPLARSGSLVAAESAVDYVIEARLEGEEDDPKLLFGKLTLTWTNGSPDTVRDLWFHLYLNAFSNNRSTQLVEGGEELAAELAAEGWGWSAVKAARVRTPGKKAAEDVFHTFRYRQPDDGRSDDRTVFSLELPRPVAPGETIGVELEWESQLPRVLRRTGSKGDFLFVAQWFPKLGVYEGGRGWNCHQYHSSTEFYADYGTYDVTLNLPARFAGHIGASGVKSNDFVRGDRTEVRFEAPSKVDRLNPDGTGKLPLVHDFVWTADPAYVALPPNVFQYARWAEDYPEEVEKARRIFGEGVDVDLRNVDVTVLIHPERRRLAYRHFEAACAALFFYGLWYGEYPYEHITVVDPAWGAGAGGMEYPTLFTAGTALLAGEDTHHPEGVVVHECGHQFWYGLVGNNEFEAAFLDEGLNSYTDSEVMHRVYGEQRETTSYSRVPIDGVAVGGDPFGGREGSPPASPVRDVLRLRRIPVPVIPDLQPLYPSGFLAYWRDQPRYTFVRQFTDRRWSDRSGWLRAPDRDPIQTNGWEFADHVSYRSASYDKTAVALRTLRGMIGEEAFLRGMRHFATTWRYRHPYPEDFYAAFQEGADVDVGWYFRALFQGTGTVDWSVAVTQERRAPPAGLFQGEGGRFLALPEGAGENEGEDEEPWRVSILLRRSGELRIDLPYRLEWEDGTAEDGTWTRDAQARPAWLRIERESPRKLRSVVLDPERRIYLDRDMSNNQWHDETDAVAPWRWGERVLAQYQRALHWIGGIGG